MQKFFIIVLAVIVVVIGGAAAFLATFDVNAYRGQIAQTLSKQTGRTVKLNGPIALGLSSEGFALDIQDAAIGNPSWASRPDMAGIGRFKIGVELFPLLNHSLVITSLEVEDADIQLESSDGHNNWDMGSTKSAAPAAPVAQSVPSSGPSGSLRVDQLSIKNSQIAMRGDDGKTVIFKAEELKLGRGENGMVLNFEGQYNGQPITLDLKSNDADLTSKAARPIDVNLGFANFHFKATGTASMGDKKASLDSYEITADKSGLHGQLDASWGGAKPDLKGTLLSDHLATADFKMPEQTPEKSGEATAAPEQLTPSQESERIFSDAPISFDALKSANASFDVTIAELALGSVTLSDLSAKIVLENGKLTVQPFKAALGSGALEGQVNLDAAEAPPHLGMTFTANSVDIGDLMQLGGIEAFLSGKVNADMNIVASGNSLHELASTTSGSVNVIGAGGDVVNSAADKVNSGLANLFGAGLGGGENASMNCMVAKFTAATGVVKDNGILIDTSATTVAGSGGADLRSETIDMLFHAKPKIVNTGGLLPPVHVGGSFLHPDFGMSAAGVMQNVAGMFLGGNTTSSSSGVPNITTAQGQNACLYTLEHPTASGSTTTQSPGGVVQQLGGKAGDAIKNLGGQLKGLLGQ